MVGRMGCASVDSTAQRSLASSADVAVRRIWPYLGILVIGLLIVAFVPWFSIGFL